MNKDQFGYYQVHRHKTYSKIEALEIAHLLVKPVEWIFNDDTFGKHPWHIDTKQDIKQLYKMRAEQLREKYDYIVIWYSGGADSFTVLNTFKENKIHVDEIAHFHSYDGDKTWDSYLNKEIESVAIPQTQEFLKTMPHTKQRVIDLTSIIKSMFAEDNNRLDFIYKFNHSFGLHHLARSYLREKIDDWKKIIDSGKKLCFVYGCDKIPVEFDLKNNKYFLQFRDIIDGCISPRTQTLGRLEEYDELFYWSPDALDLMTRQAHITVNYLRNPPEEDLDSTYLTQDSSVCLRTFYNSYVSVNNYKSRMLTMVNNLKYYLTTEGLHRLIYPDFKEDTFTLGKGFGYIINPRDGWWFNGSKGDDQTMFISAIKSLRTKFTRWGFNFVDSYPLDLQHFTHINIDNMYSKKYYLEI